MNKDNKNKGFTLIELLAVIVILGIIITIVVTNVVQYIGKAKEGAFIDIYKKVVREVKTKAAYNNLGNSETIECSDANTCASLYDVPQDIDLRIYDNGNGYTIDMTGTGSYDNIKLTDESVPDNEEHSDKSIRVSINSDGEKTNTTINDLLIAEIKNGEENVSTNNPKKYGNNISNIKTTSYITEADKDVEDAQETKFVYYEQTDSKSNISYHAVDSKGNSYKDNKALIILFHIYFDEWVASDDNTQNNLSSISKTKLSNVSSGYIVCNTEETKRYSAKRNGTNSIFHINNSFFENNIKNKNYTYSSTSGYVVISYCKPN